MRRKKVTFRSSMRLPSRKDGVHHLAAFRVRVLEQDALTAGLLMKAVIAPGDPTKEGTLIEAVAVPWFELVKVMKQDPNFMHQIDWRKWEEMVAGAYRQAGFDEVILTPRSADLGRDVIAVKRGIGSIRILDQVKKYKPGHLVTANEVRAMLGVITADSGTSKGVVTTTSEFAPGVESDELLKPFMPYRLELKSGPVLLEWLQKLASAKANGI
jgi:restriction system protein